MLVHVELHRVGPGGRDVVVRPPEARVELEEHVPAVAGVVLEVEVGVAGPAHVLEQPGGELSIAPAALGIDSVDALFADIPEHLRASELRLPPPEPELEVRLIEADTFGSEQFGNAAHARSDARQPARHCFDHRAG